MGDVMAVLANKARQEIKMPSSELERRTAAAEFYRVRNFPRVIGAIDGKIPYHSPAAMKNLNNNFMVMEVFCLV